MNNQNNNQSHNSHKDDESSNQQLNQVAQSSEELANPNRRKFLVNSTYAALAVGTACTILPFVDSMNPADDVSALASVEVDLSAIKEGQEKKLCGEESLYLSSIALQQK